MYCPQCGTEAEEGARFCAKCGRDLFDSSEQPRPAHETREAGPYAPNYRTEDRPHVPNHLVWAILAIFCCLPIGVVSIVYAAQVNGLVAAGDFAGAREASENAKRWAWVSLISIALIFLLPSLIVLLFVLVAWMSTLMTGSVG